MKLEKDKKHLNINKEIDKEYLNMYKEYNLLLKNWKFGFAAAILSIIITLVTSENSNYKLSEFSIPLYLLIIGIILQVFIAFLNKTNNWILANGEYNKATQKKWFYKAAEKVSGYYLIDFIIDLSTIVLFVLSIFLLLNCITK